MDTGAPKAQAGIKLKQLREKCGLTLRQVEADSQRLAKRKMSQDFFISRGWLNNIENGSHKLSFFKLYALEKKALLFSDAKYAESDGVLPFDHFRSWLGVPLVAAGHVLGILSLGSNSSCVLTREHLRLAKSLAVPAAVAIQNARIHERAEIYAAELALRLRELREAEKALRNASRGTSDHEALC